jgi:hypothetical protein
LPGESGVLEVSLPKSIIDGITEVKANMAGGGDRDAMVEKVSSNETHTTYTVLTPRSTSGVEFYATQVVPEFGSVFMIVGVAALISGIIVSTRILGKH